MIRFSVSEILGKRLCGQKYAKPEILGILKLLVEILASE